MELVKGVPITEYCDKNELPAEERLEGTLATTALAIAAGVDMVRVHDVRANVRAALLADSICRGE